MQELRGTIYPKPLLLLVDTDKQVSECLRTAGYDVTVGTFGRTFTVDNEDRHYPVPLDYSMPQHYTEREIVVVDLLPGGGSCPGVQVGLDLARKLDNDLFVSGKPGYVDSRLLAMQVLRPDLDRILQHGGVFVIFTAAKTMSEYYEATPQGGRKGTPSFTATTWDMLTVLGGVSVSADSGRNIEMDRQVAASHWGRALAPYLQSAHFGCTLSASRSVSEDGRWLPLASSKYGDVVAAVLLPSSHVLADEHNVGAVYLLPQMEADRKGALLAAMLQDLLPQMHPWLFPNAEDLPWIHQRPYELPRINELMQEISDVRTGADEKISSLQVEIQQERAKMTFLQDLLTETGSDLVKAVRQTLQALGFTQVVDVDAELEALGSDANKREDLQIHDQSPVLLVEVKGIAGVPSDEDALAVRKYFAPRMREWDRTDIAGLAIINHQRHLPPLQRDNSGCYREDVVVTAEKDEIGLWTCWDLYRLARSFLENNWRHDVVSDLFYRYGRGEPVPTHYVLIGAVNDRWPRVQAISLVLGKRGLAVGDRIAFELPVVFSEQDVTSLQVQDKPVDRAGPGIEVGVRVLVPFEEIAKGTRVYLVAAPT